MRSFLWFGLRFFLLLCILFCNSASEAHVDEQEFCKFQAARSNRVTSSNAPLVHLVEFLFGIEKVKSSKLLGCS